MWRTNCMHRSTPFYAGDLNIHRFGVSGGPRTHAPLTPKDDKFLESQKLYGHFWLHAVSRVGTPHPLLFKGKLYRCLLRKTKIVSPMLPPMVSAQSGWEHTMQVTSRPVAWPLNRICPWLLQMCFFRSHSPLENRC